MLVQAPKDESHPFVLINKTFFEDSNLSLKAKGLLAYFACKPDGWKFCLGQMTHILRESRYSLNSLLKELIDNEYISQSQVEYDYE